MKTLRNFFSLLTLILSLFLLLSTIFLSAQPDYNDKIRAEIKDNFPKPRSGKIYVIAHRGAHVGIPENSLPAFQKAIDLGCDFVEIDTRATKDGKIVSVHNATIDQYVSGETGRVKNFTLAELKQFSIGEKTGPEWKNTRIPAVEEILQLCRNQVGIYIDLKEPLVRKLLPIIQRFGMEREIVWYIPASRMDQILKLRKKCLPCFPMPDPGAENNVAKVTERVHPRVVATDMVHLSEGFVKAAHQAGAKVFVDEDKGNPEEWEKIISLGTDGIQTDDPAALIGFLKSR